MLQNYRNSFKSLKMDEDGNIASLFLRVDGIVNIIRGFGETIKESNNVRKILI